MVIKLNPDDNIYDAIASAIAPDLEAGIKISENEHNDLWWRTWYCPGRTGFINDLTQALGSNRGGHALSSREINYFVTEYETFATKTFRRFAECYPKIASTKIFEKMDHPVFEGIEIPPPSPPPVVEEIEEPVVNPREEEARSLAARLDGYVRDGQRTEAIKSLSDLRLNDQEFAFTVETGMTEASSYSIQGNSFTIYTLNGKYTFNVSGYYGPPPSEDELEDLALVFSRYFNDAQLAALRDGVRHGGRTYEQPIHIYLYGSDWRDLEEENGALGIYFPWNNSIYLQRDAFRETIAHEIAGHSLDDLVVATQPSDYYSASAITQEGMAPSTQNVSPLANDVPKGENLTNHPVVKGYEEFEDIEKVEDLASKWNLNDRETRELMAYAQEMEEQGMDWRMVAQGEASGYLQPYTGGIDTYFAMSRFCLHSSRFGDDDRIFTAMDINEYLQQPVPELSQPAADLLINDYFTNPQNSEGSMLVVVNHIGETAFDQGDDNTHILDFFAKLATTDGVPQNVKDRAAKYLMMDGYFAREDRMKTHTRQLLKDQFLNQERNDQLVAMTQTWFTVTHLDTFNDSEFSQHLAFVSEVASDPHCSDALAQELTDSLNNYASNTTISSRTDQALALVNQLSPPQTAMV